MFTGIIEATGKVTQLTSDGGNLHIKVQSDIGGELKIDQSVSHNGVCLTVIKNEGAVHTVTAIEETLNKTNLGQLEVGSVVNLERCMMANGRFDGHIVQGHVDTTAVCRNKEDRNGSWYFTFQYTSGQKHHITVEKGSVCVNGVSLTVIDSRENEFSVAIIPYTFEHTNFKTIQVGDAVNLEFDIIGKYIARLMEQRTN